ncbi:D-alanine--D-alanine ligase [Pseudogracilibacillus sp. SO30301A]|uniref:D-alanine--D-alanine ligase n=1 Tax=Pseudogracilibacillus sp. SO30301A TaxID=3098291 RepID=UPI00300E2183
MKIAVLYGGVSKERDVSISSSKGIIDALKANGHEVIGIDFHPDRLHEIIELNVDLVFIGLHGKFGEDGSIQGLLDMLNIPYVGSGVMASAVAMDKFKAKQLFKVVNIPIAKGERYRITDQTNINDLVEKIHRNFELPFVVKPNREGSTLGLTIVINKEQTEQAIKKAVQSDEFILVEQFIKGKELTVPVLGKMNEEIALPIIEIIPKNELYDYESKYAEGGSEHIIPAQISEELTTKIKNFAVKAHQVLGCETYSRADFLLTDEGVPYILEVNTLPGMTPTSLFPDSARTNNISYNEMIETLVQLTVN